MNYKKYKRFETIKLKDRTWPDKSSNMVFSRFKRWKSSFDYTDEN